MVSTSDSFSGARRVTDLDVVQDNKRSDMQRSVNRVVRGVLRQTLTR